MPYWDGGYAGNPTMPPLVRDPGEGDNVVLVAINPLERPGTPRTAAESRIAKRLNEISFNATIKELRMIALLKQSGVTEGEGGRWGSLRVHVVSSPAMIDLGHSWNLSAARFPRVPPGGT